MKNIYDFLKGEKGVALIKGTIMMLILLFFFGTIIDFIAYHYLKTRAKDSLTYACESAVKIHDILPDNTIRFNADSRTAFFEKIQSNFKVDNSLRPVTNTFYVRDTITIEVLDFYDEGNVSFPFPDPITSQLFDYPTVHAVITVPVRLFFSGPLVGILNPVVRVHVDVSLEDMP